MMVNIKSEIFTIEPGRTICLAWDSNSEAIGKTTEEAIKTLAKLAAPDYNILWCPETTEAAAHWEVWNYKFPGLIGVGGTVDAAFLDFQDGKTSRWWPGRFDKMVGLTRLAIQSSSQVDKKAIDDEFSEFITDIRTGSFKYEGLR